MYDETKVVIRDRREMLRVKLKSLADEARIIRHEERKTWGQLRDELRLHRVRKVRDEARHTHLAYGLVRGRTYEQMEAKCARDPDWKRVEQMWKRYGPPGAAFPQVQGGSASPQEANPGCPDSSGQGARAVAL